MIKNILWDFDGVIIDSMPIRDTGFREIFKDYDSKLVEELIKYHRDNGGLSRFVKIKYFYNNLLNKEISEKEISDLADKFSIIMKKELINEKYIIQDSLNYIKDNHKKFNFHIVSGSEHNELNYICDELSISDYFLTINGSPTPKNILVENLLTGYNYEKQETILIGDSFNDYEAAYKNQINFHGYNNDKLKEVSTSYISSFRLF